MNMLLIKKNPEQSFTGIWCAKEAVVKSFGQIKLINIKNVEIICTQNSQPKAIINKLDMENLEFKISVSIFSYKRFSYSYSNFSNKIIYER